ncbi:MAG TPA: CRTAC1 family protein [Allosphingosinicella sp.]|nr:CRTAC1 family protein [Allosphingosinicella sp.]
MTVARLIRGQAARLTVGAIALALFLVARATSGQPEPADSSLRFDAVPLGAPERPDDRRVRPVNPRYAPIRGWISAVGAAVAIADIDGDERPNDICLVEPRDDSVTVLPAPGTGARYPAFALPLPAEGYDPAMVAPMGCLPGDYDEDGGTDLLVYYWGRPPLIYYAAGGSPAATSYRPMPIVAAHESWYTNAALQADVDGDGHVDLVFGNYFPEGARVLDAAAADGGVMQRSMSRAFNGGRNRLLLRDPASTAASGFTDHSAALSPEMANGWTLALAAADLDGDLLPELYVANDFGPDRLMVNLSAPGAPRFRLAAGERTFLTPRSRTLGRDSFKGMGAEFADVNGDGMLDLAVSNIAQDYALLESHFLFINRGRPDLLGAGLAAFRDESGPRGTARNGWGWDVKAADFDNDGRPELIQALGFLAGTTNRWPELQELATANDDIISHPHVWGPFAGDADLSGHQRIGLYASDDRGIYHDVGVAAGLSARGVARGIAIADVDLDGRLDAAVAAQWRRSVLLMNRAPASGHFLALDLRLANANGTTRPAIGALARIDRDGAAPLVGFVDGGNGHSGKRAPIVHFGLGPQSGPVLVQFRWRDGSGLHRARLSLAPGHHRVLLGRPTA